MLDSLTKSQARAMILRTHGLAHVPADARLDPLLAGYDRTLELGFGLAFYRTVERYIVQTCKATQLRRLPKLVENEDEVRLLVGVYRGEPLFDGSWRGRVYRMTEETVFGARPGRQRTHRSARCPLTTKSL
ncbi:hypothetical protein GCM10009550_35040 [Actinocorallia libanotica]|uniref:Uncharacterized protein n=2 Tax=Actinocorallia libanotica TaxID=46162 RepID=A0ABN1R957_9ACTN